MPEELTILKNSPLLKSEDYYFLKEKGVESIEKLAHKLWTDYNIHDPGITLLEILCYALTDLGYRTSFDIKDILTREINGVPVIQGNFHTAQKIFPVNPVTFDDLRKVIIDIDGVHNAWIVKNQKIIYCKDPISKQLQDCSDSGTDSATVPLNGIYDVLIEYEDTIESEDRTVHIGLTDIDTETDFITAGKRGIDFSVLHPLVLQSVSVYTDTAPANVTVRLLEADSNGIYISVQEATATITQANQKTEIRLDFAIGWGKNYRLDAYGTSEKLARNASVTYPLGQELLISLNSGWDGSGTNDDYYFFYDWKISFAISPIERELSLSEDLISAPIGPGSNSTAGGYIAPSGKGLVFDIISPVTIDAVYVVPEKAGTIKIQILDTDDLIVGSELTCTVSKTGKLNRVPLDISLDPGKDYKMVISAAGPKLFRETNAAFPFEIKNVIEIRSGTPTSAAYYFFYNWEVSYRFPLVQVTALTRSDVRKAIVERLNGCRNLSEDFCAIRDLEFENIALCADIELSPEADINETLAEIFYRMEMQISPPVRFYTIKELLGKNYTIDRIFEGPLLDHGFIDDREFGKIKRTTEIRASDIIQIIMRIEGVISIKKIRLLSYIEIDNSYTVRPMDVIITRNGKKYLVREEEWILDLSDPEKLAPNFNPDLSKVIFYKNKLPYFADTKKVIDLFNEKRSHDYIRLKGHEKDLPIPVGEDKNIEDYYPVQNELPAVYLTGQFLPLDSDTDLRKAQSKQLKAFLLFFEQILANYLSQLAHIKHLFSWEDEDEIRTYFTQMVNEIAGYTELYINGDQVHKGKLEEIIEDTETALARKNIFLDHLAARFAESFNRYDALMYSLFEDEAAALLITDKKLFLEEYPAISANRGKAFDYRYPSDKGNVTGLAHRVSRLLGFDSFERPQLANQQVKVVATTIANPDGSMDAGYQFEILDDQGISVFISRACLNRDLICGLIDAAIETGADEKNWLFDETEDVWALVVPCKEKKEYIGTTNSSGSAVKEELISLFKTLYQAEGIHVIEHILLRKRTTNDPFLPLQIMEGTDKCSCPDVYDPYSFRITVLLPSWPERFRHVRFRQYVEEIIRMETPAHIYPRICWISHCEMQKFEGVYETWLTELGKIAADFRGCFPLPDIDSGNGSGLSAEEKAKLSDYRKSLKDMIDILFDLNNVYPVARLHDCQEISDENPTITLNETMLGTL
jgi:hypothetical protein